MKRAVEFIVLATTKVGDSSIVVHSLSAEYGRKSFITNATRGSRSTLYQPFAILEGEVSESTRSELWRVASCHAAHALGSIRTDLDKTALTMFMSEVLYRCLHDGEGDEALYLWCKENILLLDALEEGFASFHLQFLAGLCRMMGFAPSITDLAPFAGERLEDLKALLSLQPADFLIYPLSGNKRGEIASILIEYLSYHIGARLNIRSLAVLSEIYKD